jgi:hypothetical protein
MGTKRNAIALFEGMLCEGTVRSPGSEDATLEVDPRPVESTGCLQGLEEKEKSVRGIDGRTNKHNK